MPAYSAIGYSVTGKAAEVIPGAVPSPEINNITFIKKGDIFMALAMIQFSYKSETVSKLVTNPEDRSIAVRNLVEKLGGKLLAFYFSFGEFDGLLIADLPDNVSILASSMAAFSAGHTLALKTTILITMEEAMAAMKQTSGVKLVQPLG